MKWFFVTPFTINVLNIFLLVVFMVYFLSRNRKKSRATVFLLIFLVGVSVVFLSFVLIFSSLDHLYSTIGWWAIHMMVFASIALVQFAYYFPENIHESESKIVLVLSLIAAVGVYPYYIYRTLSMNPSYSFEGCLYAYFNTPEIGIVIGLEIVWVVVVFLRKTAILSANSDNLNESEQCEARLKRAFRNFYEVLINLLRTKEKEPKALRNLALIFISPIVLIFVIVLAYMGYLSWEIVAQIMGTGLIAAVFLFIVLYINNSSEPSSFMIKLVGVSLGIILIALGITSNIALKIRDEAYNKKRLMEVEQFKKSIANKRPYTFPDDTSYILLLPERENETSGGAKLLYSKDSEITPGRIMKSKIREYTKLREAYKMPSAKRGYRSIDPLDSDTFYIIYSFKSKGTNYEIAYSYVNYREYIHSSGLTLVFIILGSFLFVVLIMPLTFRESIVRPLDLLLEGVRQVNRGDLEVAVPVGVEDEIGYLSRSFNSMVGSIRDGEKKLRDSLDYQVRLTDSYSCFVPKEILKFLKKESIIDIKLGDNVEEEMTILFSDIRSFTMLSEKMSPQENFNFLNSCLKRLGPVVRKNRGFIDKYIGDAVMALFPRKPDDAVRAALEMQRSVSVYNYERKKCGYEPVEIGIGMHTGALMLGTIGEERRMEGTVISDTVNLASRVENLTKLYGSQIIASDVTMQSLEETSSVERRYLDRVKVKGKRKWVDIYEIIDTEFNDESRSKFRTRDDFEEGIHMYQEKDIEKALKFFRAVLKVNPGDKAAHLYHQRYVFLREHGVPEEWDGISELLEKYD